MGKRLKKKKRLFPDGCQSDGERCALVVLGAPPGRVRAGFRFVTLSFYLCPLLWNWAQVSFFTAQPTESGCSRRDFLNASSSGRRHCN